MPLCNRLLRSLILLRYHGLDTHIGCTCEGGGSDASGSSLACLAAMPTRTLAWRSGTSWKRSYEEWTESAHHGWWPCSTLHGTTAACRCSRRCDFVRKGVSLTASSDMFFSFCGLLPGPRLRIIIYFTSP